MGRTPFASALARSANGPAEAEPRLVGLESRARPASVGRGAGGRRKETPIRHAGTSRPRRHDLGPRPWHHHRVGAAGQRWPDRQRHRVLPSQPLRRRWHALCPFPRLAGPAGGRCWRAIAAIHYEEVRPHAGTDAAHVYGGLLATLTAWAEQRAIPYQGAPVGTVKKHATGKGNAGKPAMIAAARARGFDPTDDNEADALAILHWAIETRGGVR